MVSYRKTRNFGKGCQYIDTERMVERFPTDLKLGFSAFSQESTISAVGPSAMV